MKMNGCKFRVCILNEGLKFVDEGVRGHGLKAEGDVGGGLNDGK